MGSSDYLGQLGGGSESVDEDVEESDPVVNSAPSTVATIAHQQLHRVFCYGDSLTAGTSGPNLYPYAPFMEEALVGKAPFEIQVRHRGLPGWTAAQLVATADQAQTGLRSIIQVVQDPSLSLVVILAGTNDLAHTTDAAAIFQNVIRLHEIALSAGVPHTLAVGIPPSGYQSMNSDAATLAASVNGMLKTWATTTNGMSRYADFPFAFEREGENWHADGLHFSEQGYRVLGQSLAPVVLDMLNILDNAMDQQQASPESSILLPGSQVLHVGASSSADGLGSPGGFESMGSSSVADRETHNDDDEAEEAQPADEYTGAADQGYR